MKCYFLLMQSYFLYYFWTTFSFRSLFKYYFSVFECVAYSKFWSSDILFVLLLARLLHIYL